MKVDAWTDYEGWEYDDAMTAFVDLCKEILERNGFSWEDPQKEIVTQEYNDCVQR